MGIDKPTDHKEVTQQKGGIEKKTSSLIVPDGYDRYKVYGKYPQYRVELNPSGPTRANVPDDTLFFSSMKEAEYAIELQRGKIAGYIIIREITEHFSKILKSESLT